MFNNPDLNPTQTDSNSKATRNEVDPRHQPQNIGIWSPIEQNSAKLQKQHRSGRPIPAFSKEPLAVARNLGACSTATNHPTDLEH